VCASVFLLIQRSLLVSNQPHKAKGD